MGMRWRMPITLRRFPWLNQQKTAFVPPTGLCVIACAHACRPSMWSMGLAGSTSARRAAWPSGGTSLTVRTPPVVLGRIGDSCVPLALLSLPPRTSGFAFVCSFLHPVPFLNSPLFPPSLFLSLSPTLFLIASHSSSSCRPCSPLQRRGNATVRARVPRGGGLEGAAEGHQRSPRP